MYMYIIRKTILFDGGLSVYNSDYQVYLLFYGY